jgi:trehalose 6-phosphate phosphatase
MKARKRKIPHLFEDWDKVAERVRDSDHVSVFLDFDGTLVASAPRPNQVRVQQPTHLALQKLAHRRHVTLAVISGRRRSELQHYLPSPRVRYLGLYGWERNGCLTLSTSEEMDLLRTHVLLAEGLRTFPKLWIEAKGMSLSIHLRDVPAAMLRRARAAVRQVLVPFSQTLHLFENKIDIEVVPRSIKDKGAAVSAMLATRAMSGDFTLFFGDDISDEPAFAALRNGVSVLVGKPRATHAQYHLRGPEEVTDALARLDKALP